MLKKTLALFAGLLVTVAVYAASAQLRPGHPDTYVVKKGDTLWDISARFLAKPWLWPEIWQANPQVHNPHLIYPGDVLNLSYDSKHVVLKPRARVEGSPIPAIPLDELRMFLKDLRVVDSDALKRTPYVVAFEENRLRGVPGRFVYVRDLKDAQPGQRYAVVRPSHVFRKFEDSPKIVADELDSNVALVDGPWTEDLDHNRHRGQGQRIGLEVRVIGHAHVLRGGDPSTLLLDDSTREIRAGDRLLPVNDKPYDATYYPHAPKTLPDDGRVIAFTDALGAAGPKEVVALSIGRSDGVNNGQTYSIFQPGDTIHDDVASSSLRRGVGERVTLPPEFIGHVMVFRTFDHVSYGLIMDGIRPVRIGDTLKMPQ
jgi:hypothetical protein